jgi:hypothetical protein
LPTVFAVQARTSSTSFPAAAAATAADPVAATQQQQAPHRRRQQQQQQQQQQELARQCCHQRMKILLQSLVNFTATNFRELQKFTVKMMMWQACRSH